MLETAILADASQAEAHPLVLRVPVGTRLAEAERRLILLTLDAVRGNKQRAARVLGISRRGLYAKLEAYGDRTPAALSVVPDAASSEAEKLSPSV